MPSQKQWQKHSFLFSDNVHSCVYRSESGEKQTEEVTIQASILNLAKYEPSRRSACLHEIKKGGNDG